MKQSSAFYSPAVIARLRRVRHDDIVQRAQHWAKLGDDQLRRLVFGATINRAWQVLSNGHCPACQKDVTMFAWRADALRQPWKLQCTQCQEWFPKNDFGKFYRSGLDADGIFQPAKADRALLVNEDQPGSPVGIDDGEGYVDGDKRWRFIGHYLIAGQWRQLVLDGLRALCEAYVVTGERRYAHQAGVLLDRLADIHPTYDFFKQGYVYEHLDSAGYVSIWHHACFETREIVIAFDQVFDALPAATQRKFQDRFCGDVFANLGKIHCNYPAHDVTVILMHVILGWPGNRAQIMAMLDPVIQKVTAVDGLTGEKGITGYACWAPSHMAQLFSYLTLLDDGLLGELLKKYPRLHQLYRFYIDTWCLQKYYPLIGDTDWFGKVTDEFPALPWRGMTQHRPFSPPPSLCPSMFTFCWKMYELTGDAAFVQVLHHANGGKVDELPHDPFTDNPGQFQQRVRDVIAREGAELNVGSVNKEQWHLAILRSGKAANARAAWISYDAWGGHGHANGMNIGLYAKGRDLMPDNGYPPVHKGGFSGEWFDWYWSTAAHNTVVVDGYSQVRFAGKTTLWKTGGDCQVIRVEPDRQPVPLNGELIGFYLCTPGSIGHVRCNNFGDDFDRGELGPDWRVLDGEWRITNGRLTGHGTIMCTRRFPGAQRLEFDAVTSAPQPCDLSALLMAHERGLNTGAFFGFGSDNNRYSMINIDPAAGRCRSAARSEATIVCGKLYRIVCECDGHALRHWVDGKLIQRCLNDGLPFLDAETSAEKRYARTLALVDIDDQDAYVVDLFHVVGGRDHAKFVHSNFSTITTTGLALQPAPDYGHGTKMRNFRTDPTPKLGWSADWQIADSAVHLRYFDLTEGASASTCEGWIASAGYQSHAEVWIPRMMVRRQAHESLFVAVLDPHAGRANIARVLRRCDLLEVELRNGRRDTFRWSLADASFTKL